MYEVEQKFIDETGAFIKHLQTLEINSSKRTIDEYIDVDQEYKLFLEGTFIRVRTENGKSVIDFKFDTPELDTGNSHDFCIERSFDLSTIDQNMHHVKSIASLINLKWDDSIKSFDEFKTLNNLVAYVTIDKNRNTYKMGDYSVMWDHVDKLGEFVEIEIMEEKKENIAERVAEIRSLGSSYKMRIIQAGYVELYLEKYNNSLYQKGRFKI